MSRKGRSNGTDEGAARQVPSHSARTRGRGPVLSFAARSGEETNRHNALMAAGASVEDYCPDFLSYDVEVLEADGQSWQAICNHTAAEIDQEDVTGLSGAAVRGHRPERVLGLRAAHESYHMPIKGTARPWRKHPESDGIAVVDLHPLELGDGFTVAEATACCREILHERWDLRPRSTIVLNVGGSAQVHSKFLPPHAGGLLVNGEERHLWVRNIETRGQIERFMHERYGREVRYGPRTMLQGPHINKRAYRDFLESYRLEQDTLSCGPRDAFNDQGAMMTGVAEAWLGQMAQLEFHQFGATADEATGGASGRDWLVMPRHALRMRDRNHHSSLASFLLAEMTALAMCEVERFGSWTPLWVRPQDIVVQHRRISLRTSLPRHGTGELVLDMSMEAPFQEGFRLQRPGGEPIEIEAVGALDREIVLVTRYPLRGRCEISYAMRGWPQRDGSPAAPSHSGCWGRVRMPSTVERAILPGRHEYPLCAFAFEIEVP